MERAAEREELETTARGALAGSEEPLAVRMAKLASLRVLVSVAVAAAVVALTAMGPARPAYRMPLATVS